MTKSRGFTLIELLVVIAIIAILAAILFPVFAQAKAAAKKAVSISNMKQEVLALNMYATDYDDRYICEWPYNNFNGEALGGAYDQNHTFHPYLNPYVKNKDIWQPPGGGSEVMKSVNMYGVTDPWCPGNIDACIGTNGNDPALTGGYPMGYLMNESGWSDDAIESGWANLPSLNKTLGAGLNASELSHPAEQVIFIEATGLKEWMTNGYQVGFTTDGALSTIPQPSDPNMGLTWKQFYNVPGCDWGSAGFPDIVKFRYGAEGNPVAFFDGHVKFSVGLKLKNVQPSSYDFDKVATNW